jgi:hypothetical protein
LQVYCTLQPVLRFAPFLSSSVIAPTRLRAVRPTPLVFPGSAVFLHTLQSFPLVVRRTASPRPLPSRRFLSDLKAFLVRQVRCPFLVLPPDRTRCSPGLRSPSGCSPLVQPAIGVPEQDPLVQGGDHRWCSRAIADLTRSSPWRWPGLFVTFRAGLLQIFARLPTNTVAVTFPGLSSCTLLHANAQEDTQAGPSKIILIRLVAFFLYFGFPKL